MRQVQDEKTELEYNRACLRLSRRFSVDLVSTVANLEKLRIEEQRLMDIVKVQNLSPEEVLRMNTEHENMSRERTVGRK